MLLAGLTLLPALLTVGRPRAASGRAARPVAYTAEESTSCQRAGLWRRFGDRVLRRPGLALGGDHRAVRRSSRSACSPTRRTTRSAASSRSRPRASTASRCSARSFPQGALGPDGDPRPARRRRRDRRRPRRGARARGGHRRRRVGQRAAALGGRRDREGRRHVRRRPLLGRGARARGHAARRACDDLPGGATALVGAGSAVQEDFNVAAERDLRVIVPVALLVIAIILGILLQAVVAPLVLIATVLASFFGTLGLSIFFFIEVQGNARRRRVAADVRVHLPRRARRRLHDLPDEPRARGGARRTARARACCARWRRPARSSRAPA